jgi:hypothetical protein
MYVCLSVCMYSCLYVCLYVLYVFMSVCMSVCVYVLILPWLEIQLVHHYRQRGLYQRKGCSVRWIESRSQDRLWQRAEREFDELFVFVCVRSVLGVWVYAYVGCVFAHAYVCEYMCVHMYGALVLCVYMRMCYAFMHVCAMYVCDIAPGGWSGLVLMSVLNWVVALDVFSKLFCTSVILCWAEALIRYELVSKFNCIEWFVHSFKCQKPSFRLSYYVLAQYCISGRAVCTVASLMG